MKKIRIVIIEDNALMADMLSCKIQEDPMFEVVGCAKDGPQGIQMVSTLNPDIVIADIILPGMDGITVINRISKLHRSKILVLSSLSDDRFVTKALESGASYYMMKPVNIDVLKSRMIDLMCDFSYEKNEDYSQEAYSEFVELENSNRSNIDKISNILISIGIPASIVGYRFLREAIDLAIKNPDAINAITKQLYPEVAKKFTTTSSSVERAIRHAIDVAWTKGKINNLNKIFNMDIYTRDEKPTNSEFIALIADKLVGEKVGS